MLTTTERVPIDANIYNYVYQRCLFAYEATKNKVSGNVLEIGTGSGLGVSYMADHCSRLVTIDKFKSEIDLSQYKNVEFIQMEIPPFTNLPSAAFDYLITFQVIEHIEDDNMFLKEIHRVLKPGGKAFITTPNRLQSLSRNPWHVREYTIEELRNMAKKYFREVDMMGTYGNENVNAYIEENRKAVEKWTRWDIFKLQWRLPRKLLQIPFDLVNSLNRKNLAKKTGDLSSNIKVNDFRLEVADSKCLDLFCVCTK